MSLPPLPSPAVQPSELIPNSGGVLGALYTEYQMKAYGQACREQALEDAAQICEKYAPTFMNGHTVALHSALEIRNLK